VPPMPAAAVTSRVSHRPIIMKTSPYLTHSLRAAFPPL